MPAPIALPERKLQINFKADTIYGDLVFNGSLSINDLQTVEIEETTRYYEKNRKEKCDIRLNSEHDLLIVNNDLDLVYDIDNLIQKLKIRLQVFWKEWFLDTSIGIDFFNVIFVKNPNLNLIDNVIKMTIMETEGIKSILEYQSELIML